ncbi:MAG: hypothetical protein WC059_03405 [Candidatus Paceibacterota bacterium]
MAITTEVELRILRKLTKALLKKDKLVLSDARRNIGNFCHDYEENHEEVAEVLGKMLGEAVAETFDLQQFKTGSH